MLPAKGSAICPPLGWTLYIVMVRPKACWGQVSSTPLLQTSSRRFVPSWTVVSHMLGSSIVTLFFGPHISLAGSTICGNSITNWCSMRENVASRISANLNEQKVKSRLMGWNHMIDKHCCSRVLPEAGDHQERNLKKEHLQNVGCICIICDR